ncbi:hypothetical protein JL722_15005 [Aureococcus anophagefferens]|nr:hypothetical protein JL722_15005 [Aureococcus anophagefferens]
MAWQKTVYSSRGASIEGDEWDEPSFEDCALDETVVIVDDGARYAAYEATWTVLPEEKRLDLQNHGRIGQSETGDGALQGLDDLCTLFDDGDGYDDASIDLGGNRLGTLGVEEVRSQLGLARFAECLRDRFGTRFGHALVHLDLSGNTLLGVGGHRMLGMKELVKCMRRVDRGAGTLRHLNLSRNELHHEGARFLAEMLAGPGLEALEVLDVSDNYLCTSAAGVPTDAGFEIFAQAVRHHGALTALGSDDDAAAARASLERLMLAGAADGAERPVERSEPVAMSGTAKRRRAEERAHRGARARDPKRSAPRGEVWSLWFSERGAKNKEALEEIDLMIGSGEACWEDASQAAAAGRGPPDWPEPLNRSRR